MARNLGGQVTRASRGIPNFQIPCFGVKDRNLKPTLETRTQKNTRANYGRKVKYLGVFNFIPPGLEGQLGLSNRFTFTHDPSPVCPD